MAASGRGAIVPKDLLLNELYFTKSITTCKGGMKARCLVANDITVQNLNVLNNLVVPAAEGGSILDGVSTQMPLTGDGFPANPIAILAGASTCQQLAWNPSSSTWDIVRNSAATETTVGPVGSDAQFNDLASALAVCRFVRVIGSYTDTSAWSATVATIIYIDPGVVLTLGQGSGTIDIALGTLLFEGAVCNGLGASVVNKTGAGAMPQFTGIGNVLLRNLTLAFDTGESNFLSGSGSVSFENVLILLSDTPIGVLTPSPAPFTTVFQHCEFNGAGFSCIAFDSSGVVSADISLVSCRLVGTFDPALPAIDLNATNASVNGLLYELSFPAIVNLSGVVSDVGPTEGNSSTLTINLEGTKATNLEADTLTISLSATGIAVSNVSVVNSIVLSGTNQLLTNFEITGSGADLDLVATALNCRISNGTVNDSIIVAGPNNDLSNVRGAFGGTGALTVSGNRNSFVNVSALSGTVSGTNNKLSNIRFADVGSTTFGTLSITGNQTQMNDVLCGSFSMTAEQCTLSNFITSADVFLTGLTTVRNVLTNWVINAALVITAFSNLNAVSNCTVTGGVILTGTAINNTLSNIKTIGSGVIISGSASGNTLTGCHIGVLGGSTHTITIVGPTETFNSVIGCATEITLSDGSASTNKLGNYVI